MAKVNQILATKTTILVKSKNTQQETLRFFRSQKVTRLFQP